MKYLVTFSIDLTENLVSKYNKFIKCIEGITKNSLTISKTSIILDTTKREDEIRDYLTNELKGLGTNGNIFVVDITYSNWAGHVVSEESARWINKNLN